MIARHQLRMTAVCPVNGGVDFYDVTVTVRRLLAVEDINGAALRARGPMYQEELTEALASELAAHVVTVGLHSGVTTTCEHDGS